MMHRLAMDDVEIIAELPEEARREVIVYDLGFLKAEDVGLLFRNQPLDEPDPGADRVDVPGCNFQPFAHGDALTLRLPKRKRRAFFRPAPGSPEKGPRTGGMVRGPT